MRATSDVAADPKPSPDLAVALDLPRAMPPGRLRSPSSSAWSEIAGFGPRVALPAAARRLSAGRSSWRRNARAGPMLPGGAMIAAAGRRPDPCRLLCGKPALSAATYRQPQRAEGLRHIGLNSGSNGAFDVDTGVPMRAVLALSPSNPPCTAIALMPLCRSSTGRRGSRLYPLSRTRTASRAMGRSLRHTIGKKYAPEFVIL